MTILEILPLASYFGTVAVAVLVIRNLDKPMKGVWTFPALLCVLFLAWTLVAIVKEGLFGFWPNHSTDMWGNQVWFDLLLAIGIGWFLLAPRAKKTGMNLWLWLVGICTTGCIGLLAMLARYLYLEERQRAACQDIQR